MSKKLLAYLGGGPITEEDAKKLTHINIAFGHIYCNGHVEAREHEKVKMVSTIKSWNPDIKIMVSLVPGEPGAFTVCAADQTLREKVGQSIVSLIKDCDLDGIDLDWEFPCVPSNGQDACPEDRENFTYLCIFNARISLVRGRV